MFTLLVAAVLSRNRIGPRDCRLSDSALVAVSLIVTPELTTIAPSACMVRLEAAPPVLVMLAATVMLPLPPVPPLVCSVTLLPLFNAVLMEVLSTVVLLVLGVVMPPPDGTLMEPPEVMVRSMGSSNHAPPCPAFTLP